MQIGLDNKYDSFCLQSLQFAKNVLTTGDF